MFCISSTFEQTKVMQTDLYLHFPVIDGSNPSPFSGLEFTAGAYGAITRDGQ